MTQSYLCKGRGVLEAAACAGLQLWGSECWQWPRLGVAAPLWAGVAPKCQGFAGAWGTFLGTTAAPVLEGGSISANNSQAA